MQLISATKNSKNPEPFKPRNFVFVLIENFSLLSFAALECLRISNRMSNQILYDWEIISENGTSIICSAGIEFSVDHDLNELNRDDTIMLCGGENIRAATTKRLLSWLRRESRRGLAIAGLCTGAFPLAKAGLLEGKRATIHWENQDSFTEEFENVELTKSVFIIEGNRMTTAGGTSSIDLMLKLIANDHGEDLANAVADQLIYSSIRTTQDVQRLSVPTRLGVRHPKLGQVIQMMERNIEEPISPSDTGKYTLAMSTRQLERLVPTVSQPQPKAVLHGTCDCKKPAIFLMQTDMSVINVALSCGFSSPSHFSKCYRSHYETTPYRERGTHSKKINLSNL